ncbi:hypothetical protein TIFTF001_003076 [Ficus carica]|uniref:Uncharacterized protein n=1 Tax=Ficus carica TaxID=3494 RepID=A0AA88D9J1_FICCA|nr:hypothetical protein TIFTF001_003076 [Ficus carica]
MTPVWPETLKSWSKRTKLKVTPKTKHVHLGKISRRWVTVSEVFMDGAQDHSEDEHGLLLKTNFGREGGRKRGGGVALELMCFPCDVGWCWGWMRVVVSYFSIAGVGGLPKTGPKQVARENMEKHLVSGVKLGIASEAGQRNVTTCLGLWSG